MPPMPFDLGRLSRALGQRAWDSSQLQGYTQFGGLRPFGVSFLVAGYDAHHGFQPGPLCSDGAWRLVGRWGTKGFQAFHIAVGTAWMQGRCHRAKHCRADR